ncbi:MAG: hypothetical protein ACJAV6_000021 [Candidatus Paceibacteria bacterium]|jgi:hypothetical protein
MYTRKKFTNTVSLLVLKNMRADHKKNIQNQPKRSFGVKGIIMTLSFLAIIVGLFDKNNSDRAYAELKVFPSSECYGDGHNLKNATGFLDAPELDGEDFRYTNRNSALITGSFSEVVCGGFKGYIPEYLPDTKVFLRLSWGLAPRSHTIDKSGTSLTTATDKQKDETLEGNIPLEEPLFTHLEEIDILDSKEETTELITTSEIKEEKKVEEKLIENNEPIKESSNPLETQTEIEKLEPESTSENNESLQPDLEDETVVDEDGTIDSKPEPESTSENNEFLQSDLKDETVVVGLDNNIVDTSDEKEAEEMLPSDSEKETIGTDLNREFDVLEEEKDFQNSLQSDLEDTDQTIILNLDADFRVEVIDETPEPLIEVLYTLDGESWVSLGLVTQVKHGDRFELPPVLFSPEVDFSQVQVAIQTLSSFNETSQLYVDAVWFEIQEPEEIPMPTLPPEALSTRTYSKEIVIQNSTAHSCKAEVFHIDISGKRKANTRIILKESNMQTDFKDASIITDTFEEFTTLDQEKILSSYKVEIGSLPLGIDIVFADNDGYVYLPKRKETLLDLNITIQKNAPKGNFTVPIIYTYRDETYTSVICQINITNQL